MIKPLSNKCPECPSLKPIFSMTIRKNEFPPDILQKIIDKAQSFDNSTIEETDEYIQITVPQQEVPCKN